MANQQFDNSDGRLRGRALQERRLRIWSAHPHCAGCGRLTDYPQGFQLDHRIPLFKGGEDKEENLQVLCIPCHDAKTNQDLGRTEKVHIGVDGWPETGGDLPRFQSTTSGNRARSSFHASTIQDIG